VASWKTPEAALKEAYARYLLAAPAAVATLSDSITVAQVCETYLDQCEAVDAAATLEMRRNTHYDFCTGLPPRLRGKESDASRAELDVAPASIKVTGPQRDGPEAYSRR